MQKVGGTGASTLGAASGGNDMSAEARERSTTRSYVAYTHICGKCGAERIDHQIGLEQTPGDFVQTMVEVFREVRRVLTPHGTLWLNLGDSYVSSQQTAERIPQVRDNKAVHGDVLRPYAVEGLAPKNLVGVPWRVAFALQDDGWYLRSDIVWSKPNPMPESITDRPTKSHEYIFMLTKNARYFFDQEAVREPHQYDGRKKLTHDHKVDKSHLNYANMGTTQERWPNGGRNMRSVWEIATQPYPEAHFATFPEELPRRCIAAGTSEKGKCPECGAPWERIVERTPEKPDAARVRNVGGRTDGLTRSAEPGGFGSTHVETTGWRLSCGHALSLAARGLEIWEPCVVLDPFMGSGTTAHVARKLGRHSIGIELNPEYAELIANRTRQLSLLS